MSWFLPPSAAELKQQHLDLLERLARASEERRKREQAQAEWLKAHTCPHCGQHPPVPPWIGS